MHGTLSLFAADVTRAFIVCVLSVRARAPSPFLLTPLSSPPFLPLQPWMGMPPLGCSTWPLMYEESISDARKT
jgi:hypothetical protein